MLEVEVLFHNTELEDKPFADVLNDVLNSEIKKSFKRKMQVSIQNYIKSLNSKEVIEPKHNKPVREELMPESWKQNKANQEPKKKVVMSEEEKQAIREQVKQLSNG
ncbi:hypothetical protein [Peribacillus asahii]|uniref:hypothetical protein n=1 Tax=Peribacillus asahii TaxID=228899 RepID=UPI002079E423|nr:hypothetical protein [Peribacillus asahii]USK72646.1 hypothetical protein LIS76_23255 [Peribacillus asahii]